MLIYGLQKKDENKLNAEEMGSLRNICRKSTRDGIKNEGIRREHGVEEGVNVKIKKGMLRWFENFERMDNGRLTKKYTWKKRMGKKTSETEKDMGEPDLGACIGAICQNRAVWQSIIAAYSALVGDSVKDGADLPPKIGFDVSDEVNLPSCRASFLCNPQGQDLIREFLKQYYAIYDSDSRQSLLEAYHENAMLSISINYGHYENRGVPSNRLHHYSSQNRNLNRLTDREGRRKLLKTGKLQVVSSLSDLPKTQHDLQTFSVDLTTFTPTFIAMAINGVFKETSLNITPKPLRSFHRTLVIVPNGSGFCIQNDLFFITNVTKEQEDVSFKDPIIASTIVSPSVAPVQAPIQYVPDEAAKLQMVQALAQQSGMNIQWSTNCLEQTNWDYQRGVFIFTELQKEGKIPPEAFVT